jgi:hypothetical protein
MTALLAVLLSVALAPPFGTAEASALRAGDELELRVSVEVEVAAVAVLARPVGIDGVALPPVALSNTSQGIWQGLVTVPARPDLRIGFELIAAAGSTAVVSEAHTLVELGVDAAVLRAPSSSESPQPQDDDGHANGWGWLGLGAAAAALAVLALWAFGRVDNRSGKSDNSGNADQTAADA